MAPEYKQAATSLKGSLTVAAVNLNDLEREAAQTLADKLGITALPTVRYVRAGNHLEYYGPRTVDGFLKFVKGATAKVVGEAREAAAESAEAAKAEDAAGSAERKEAPAAAEATSKPPSKIGMSKVQPQAAAATAT